jgi:hypothetical protein
VSKQSGFGGGGAIITSTMHTVPPLHLTHKSKLLVTKPRLGFSTESHSYSIWHGKAMQTAREPEAHAGTGIVHVRQPLPARCFKSLAAAAAAAHWVEQLLHSLNCQKQIINMLSTGMAYAVCSVPACHGLTNKAQSMLGPAHPMREMSLLPRSLCTAGQSWCVQTACLRVMHGLG